MALALAGCGSGAGAVKVSVAAYSSNPLCAKASAHWPATVSSQSSRKVSVSSPTVRAWGNPAIIARCGVGTPAPTSSGCLQTNGIDWVSSPLDDGTRFVTFGRSPAIEVLIPTKYAAWGLAAFAAAAGQIPQNAGHCS